MADQIAVGKINPMTSAATDSTALVPPYTPFDSGRYRMAMGLQSLKLDDWIEIGPDREEQLAERERLLRERRDEVLAVLPEAEEACAELLEHLVAFLPRRFPDLYRRSGSRLASLTTEESWTVAPPEAHPLVIAGHLVQEDFCLMQKDLAEEEGAYRLTAAVLCFPGRWLLADKIGQPMLAIHDPVPAYAEKLGRPVDRFLNILKPDKPVWRVNWSLTDDPALFQPKGHGREDRDPDITKENAGARVFLRCERQTLMRLPRSNAIVFGIRTHLHPLAALATLPEAAWQLAGVLRSAPEDMARYKSLPVFREAVDYLEGLAAGSTAS
mgnify:FL=1